MVGLIVQDKPVWNRDYIDVDFKKFYEFEHILKDSKIAGDPKTVRKEDEDALDIWDTNKMWFITPTF